MSRAYTDRNVTDLDVRLTDLEETQSNTQETQEAKTERNRNISEQLGTELQSSKEREKKINP